MKIYWCGNPYFSAELASLNVDGEPLHEVVADTFHGHNMRTWDQILDACGGTAPDAVVVADTSGPPIIPGVEHLPCLTALICVDTHIHSWLPRYAQGFDTACLNLRDHTESFRHQRLPDERIHWLPLYARTVDVPPETPIQWEERDYDVLFLGKVHPELTPIRHAMLDTLRGHLGQRLTVMQGNYRTHYPRARIVLNIAERGDLNFRVFEALALKSTLVTPDVGHGFHELFTDGEHCLAYNPDDVDALAQLLRELLDDPDRCNRVAENGFALVDAQHRAINRAEAFSHFLAQVPENDVDTRIVNAPHITESYTKLLYLHWAEETTQTNLGTGTGYAAHNYLQAATGTLVR